MGGWEEHCDGSDDCKGGEGYQTEPKQITTISQWLSNLQCNETPIYICIPFLGIARPQSKFPHSGACEWFIYSQDTWTFLAAAK